MEYKLTCCFILTLYLNLFPLWGQINFPEIEDWERPEQAKIYTSDNLWEYINGAAEYYLNYGFTELEVIEYSYSEDVYIKAEVYKHSTPLNTFGIYAYERPTDIPFMKIGSQGYMQHSAFNYYMGNYYIKVHSNHSDTLTLNAIKSIAKGLETQNKSDIIDTIPAIFQIFPSENKISNSEKYIPVNYLGYDFLYAAIEASYKVKKDKFKLFVIHTESEKIIHMLNSYFEFVKLGEEPVEDELFEVNDVFNGKVFLIHKKDKLFGVYNCENKNVALEYIRKMQ